MPKGTRKVHFSFEESHLTHFGGMWLIQRFCNKLRLRWLLQKHLEKLRRTRTYHPAELILALLFAIIMGLRRINKTDILQYNGAFLEMLGLKRFPDQSTLRRFLKRLPPKSIRQLVRLHDSLRAYLFALPRKRSSLVFDLDSTVLIVYGRAEGARVGYNPKKPGRRSYHPLLCFEARAQGCRFQASSNGWEVAEFQEKVHHKMERPHRFIVVRRPIPQDPEDAAQLTLFKDRKYAYHVLVTNLRLSPWRVYRFYSLRAPIEKNIREFVYDYPLGKIPTDRSEERRVG